MFRGHERGLLEEYQRLGVAIFSPFVTLSLPSFWGGFLNRGCCGKSTGRGLGGLGGVGGRESGVG